MKLEEMAKDYRLAAAKIAMYLHDHRKLGDLDLLTERSLKASLKELRATARIMETYYTEARSASPYTFANFKGKKLTTYEK